MDFHLRELERLVATGDEQSLRMYLISLVRSGEIDKVEWQARLGDQQALTYFLLALDYTGEIDLRTFWVYPFLEDAFSNRNILAPAPIPYQLGMTFSDVKDIFSNKLGYVVAIKGAYVVEDLTIEMAEKVLYDINIWLPEEDQDTALREYLIEYSIIRAGALLLIDNRGTIFPPIHELGHYTSRQQQSMRLYKRRAQDRNRFDQAKLIIPDLVKRKFIPHMDQYMPDLVGGDKQRYKVVLHVPSGRAYTNDRGYNLLEETVGPEVVLDAMRFHNQIDVGQKATTGEWQEPVWSRELPDEEFITYTVGT